MTRSARREDPHEGSLKETSNMRSGQTSVARGSNEQQTHKRVSSRRATVEDDEEEIPNEPRHSEATPNRRSNAEDNAEEGPNGSPKGRKRARKNTVGEAHIVNADGAEDVKPDLEAPRTTLPRDPKDGFIPGSIVRVQLKNFVTYDYVEFFPGPYLNMILGPNGTGKSTIACAICLGLNFPAAVLGRANEINLFVKKPCDKGYIEIELKGPQGKKNLVIRRNLSSKSKTSTFILNGHPSTGKEVSEKIAELNIQVSNLCSFLPQDKVSSFAQMTPQELLTETQRAAGDPRLTQWHETLISAGKDLREVTEQLTTEREALRVAEDRNRLLENDVQRFNQRKILERDIKLLGLAIPVCDYLQAKDTYTELKNQNKEEHARVRRLEAKNKPAHTLKEELEKQKKALERQRDQKQKIAQQRLQAMKSVHQDNEKLEKESDKIQEALDHIREDERARIAKIAKYEDTIKKHQRELDNPPETEPEEPLIERQREIQQQSSGIRDRQQAFQARQRSNIDESARQKAEIRDAMDGIARLENVAEQKLAMVRQMDKDTADTIVWLRNRENQRRFKMEIFEPPAISLKVDDARFVNAIEACFNFTQMKTFITQCPEDSALLNRLVNDSNEALGRKGRIVVWYRPRGELNPEPLSREEMQQLGFDGYALDYISCPDGMLWFLQKEINLHRTAIALNQGSVDTNRAMDAVSNPARGGGANFIVGKVFNMVSRSAYGQRLASNQTRDIGNAKTFAKHNVDQNLKREFDVRIADARKNLQDLEAQHRGMADEEREINDSYAQYKKELEDLVARRKRISSVQQRILRLNAEIKTTRKSLEEERKRPSGDEKKAGLKQKLFEVARKRAKAVKQYTEYMRMAIKDGEEATAAGLLYVQTCANHAALEAKIKEKDAKFDEAMADFDRVNKLYLKSKKEVKEKLEYSKGLLAQAEPEIQELFKSMENRLQADRKAELETELDNMRAQLDLHMATNPGVVEQYEKRKLEIASLRTKIEQKEKNQTKIQRNIDSARANWQPALERLVASVGEKFSAAFDRIGCAGEIRIKEEEDFAKWSIIILVKFRDTDKLQQLTPQRQSGGERSLTTILYLMSLTEQARAPFSLVDEINQGMDQRAERAVHNQMVEVTCKPDACQYFLITPKLLPGLKYHKLMKLLCVNNGEWLPEVKGLGNMNSMIEAYLSKRRGKGPAAT